jgi:hypothetical protein
LRWLVFGLKDAVGFVSKKARESFGGKRKGFIRHYGAGNVRAGGEEGRCDRDHAGGGVDEVDCGNGGGGGGGMRALEELRSDDSGAGSVVKDGRGGGDKRQEGENVAGHLGGYTTGALLVCGGLGVEGIDVHCKIVVEVW